MISEDFPEMMEPFPLWFQGCSLNGPLASPNEAELTVSPNQDRRLCLAFESVFSMRLVWKASSCRVDGDRSRAGKSKVNTLSIEIGFLSERIA